MSFYFESFINLIIVAGSLILILQGLITLLWMLYAWEDPGKAKSRRSPKKFLKPYYSFTALVPMRHEERVAEDTINAISNIDYPKHLKETIIICRHDDKETIDKASEFITRLGDESNVMLVLVDTFPINKPLSLNLGLSHTRNNIVAIFDAEDEPHPDLYNIVNTVIQRDKVDVVQSGVQLMNYNSHWFSSLNVTEYFLWFKSGLSFFTDVGKVAFLGGNTVFFKRKFLKLVGGWDENCLTEDADIGIRLTNAGAKTKVIYDSVHATKEETPSSVEEFIRQRTRWNQGYLQILFKRDWLKLPSLTQKLVTLYVLLAPFFPIILFLYIPFGIWVNFMYRLPVVLAIITYIPLYFLAGIMLIQILGFWEFTKSYRLSVPLYYPLKILLTYFPYMAVLWLSSVRAIYRFVFSFNAWEKTSHLNAHRVEGLSG